MKVVINGKFLEDKMQGIVRHATQIIVNMDEHIKKDDEIILLCPPNVKPQFELTNIKVVNYGKRHGIKWELFDLKRFLKNNRDYYCLNLCNVSPLLKSRNITTIHDVIYRSDYKYYTSVRNKLSALWHRYQYRYNAKKAVLLLTDSEYSKEQIEKYYPKSKDKINVVYCGCEHVYKWKEEPNWEKQYPKLTKGQFFFSLASISKNKNGKWILEVAKRNPQYTFAIAGHFYNDKNMIADSVPSNVYLLGYVSDEVACSLIKNCKAFLFPSINEGFGLPPLEALCLGATVISSNYASMPEILGNCVHYVDPYNYDVNLDKLLEEKTDSYEVLLEKFNWSKSAKQIYDLLQEINKN